MQPASDRPGPPAIWARFDRAVKQIGVALEGDGIKLIADAFAQLSTVAGELAHAVEEAQSPGVKQQRVG